jgi:hypothetical protein
MQSAELTAGFDLDLGDPTMELEIYVAAADSAGERNARTTQAELT